MQREKSDGDVQGRLATRRVVQSMLGAVVATATMAPPGEIFAVPSPKKEHTRQRSHLSPLAYGAPRGDPCVELDAGKMRFGSVRWWARLREGGRGGETP